MIEIAVPDPTFGRDSVTVGLELPRLRPIDADGITLGDLTGGTMITPDTKQAYGRSRTARLGR